MISELVTVGLVAAVACAAALIIWKLRTQPSGRATGSGDDFDIRRYRVMERLISGDDIAFLSANGVTGSRLRQVRSERRRLLSRYLRNLEMDFLQLHREARAMLLSAPEDRPDLASAILAQQIAFRRTLWSLKLRLYVPGFTGAADEVSRLLGAVESMAANARPLRATLSVNA